MLPHLCAQDLETIARAYRKAPTPEARNTLLRYASQHAKDTNGALALLALAQSEFEQQKFQESLAHATAAQKRLSKIEDYVGFLRSSAQAALKNYGEAIRVLHHVWESSPASPLVSSSALLAAEAALANEKPKQAFDVLEKHYTTLSQPQGDFLLATSLERRHDAVAAATYYQRVYFGFPDSPQAEQAASALTRLKELLGESYPPAMPQVMLGRALKLVNSREYAKGQQELQALIPQLRGPQQELARVQVGVADFLGNKNKAAYDYLQTLQVTSPEADAERLFYVFRCAQRLEKETDRERALDRLAEYYPHSKWRLEALVAAANGYLIANRASDYQPLYRACFESFPRDPQAAYCHWKIVFNSYLHRRADSAEMLRTHLKSYPASDKAPAALYFLGRLAEQEKDLPSATTYFQEVTSRFPNYYYAVLSRERLKDAATALVAGSPSAREFLDSIPFPVPSATQTFQSTATTRLRIERSHLLRTAGLDEWAESELRFGARNDGQSNIFAMEMAEVTARRDAPDQGIRYIKSFAPGYLSMPLNSAPASFWKLAFPLPYRAQLERYCRALGLDPFLVAALIRQESEFNPHAISRANAYGLTQVMPSTGRQIGRSLHIRGFQPFMLFLPDTNLQIGTYYLRSMLDQLSGKWEATLASYNAGKSRVTNWLSWAQFREPAEFVESIPFSETRNYVQSVLRNADVYRRLYAPKASAVISSDGNTSRKDARTTNGGQ